MRRQGLGSKTRVQNRGMAASYQSQQLHGGKCGLASPCTASVLPRRQQTGEERGSRGGGESGFGFGAQENGRGRVGRGWLGRPSRPRPLRRPLHPRLAAALPPPPRSIRQHGVVCLPPHAAPTPPPPHPSPPHRTPPHPNYMPQLNAHTHALVDLPEAVVVWVGRLCALMRVPVYVRVCATP